MQTLKRVLSLMDSLALRLAVKCIQVKTMLFYRLLFGEIGRCSIIYKPLRLLNPHNIFVGDHVYLYKQARIETIEKWGDVIYTPKIVIGNRVSFEQRLHLICVELVEIGDDTVVSADVMITDNSHSYQEIHRKVMDQSLKFKKTIIGKFCFIGMGARIMAGTKLGDNCIVGSNSVVSGQFPGYVVLAGAPAKIIKRYDFETNKWRKTNDKGDFINEV